MANEQDRPGENRKAAGAADGPSPPSISTPKSGGAIRSIGEKFGANPVNGTGSMTIPIAMTPGRSGFGPQLSLSYDSGSGNGPFGFGWTVSLPAITRKTEKGLPRYDDARESDVFMLAGGEDLVQSLNRDGTRYVDDETAPGYTIHRYRPRIEGLFTRIERWTRRSDGDVHWRSISMDNVLTVYGEDSNSRIVDAADPLRIFSWLVCQTRNDKGDVVLYGYKPEDGAGIDPARACERNRGDLHDARRKTNRYIKRIRYGNRAPLLNAGGGRPRFLSDLPAEHVDGAGWMFEAVFDYGEHDPDIPTPDDAAIWPLRLDAFSSHRAGFEVRTCRLCRRVLMFHHIPALDSGEVGYDGLTRSTSFGYSSGHDVTSDVSPVYSFLVGVTETGYRRERDGYEKRNLPPVEFEYTRAVVQSTVEEVDPVSLENLPVGIDAAEYQWTDLHGEGIPGILTEQGGAWFYKRNLSPISAGTVDFAPLELVRIRPTTSLTDGEARFMDLAGDGQPDLVVLDGPMPGLYEHDEQEGWEPFRPFTSRLNRDSRDPNIRFVDLDGDGHADVLITEHDAFVWHPSLGERGFGESRRVPQARDEEKGPRLVFADATQSIYLADADGDGLADLMRVRNREVCYWPNLGYGRFGAKITMDNSPHFDDADQFAQSRIRLADIDGTGPTDIIYLHRDGVRLYFNRSGNGWSEPQRVNVFPRVDELASIAAADLLGNGTACLVWSSPAAGERRPMRYVNLMGGQKPHLLIRTANNLGAETIIQYAPSTKFYLLDRRIGKPWVTKLPFPVHVVERVETHDRINHNRLVTRYAFHHGYFDAEEREFRGFGMVEQWDTEELGALPRGSAADHTNIDAASHVPPVLTRTWFDTGASKGPDTSEYYREPGLSDTGALALLLPDRVLPSGLTAEEEREARRALKGYMHRQEVYALDGTPAEKHPYTVAERTFSVRLEQRRGRNRHAVFYPHSREALTYHYERTPTDPRVQHALVLEMDAFGHVLKEAAVAYGRRQPDPALPTPPDREKQSRTLITYTESVFTNAVDDVAVAAEEFRAPLPCETRTYELTGFHPDGQAARVVLDDWIADDFAVLRTAAEIKYGDTADRRTPQRRLIEHVRTLYRSNDLIRLLPLGTLETLALPGESYKLAFTPELAAHAYVASGRLDAEGLRAALADEGKYVHSEGDPGWWTPSGRIFFSPKTSDTAAEELAYARRHFFLPHRTRDPFHSEEVSTDNVIQYDGYDLMPVDTRDALGNRVTAGERMPDGTIDGSVPGNDYRVLQPSRVMDPNRNRTRVAFDALGMAVGTAVMGKPEEAAGDSLDGLVIDLPEETIAAHVADPLADPHAVLGRATTRLIYDLFAYVRTKDKPQPQPPVTYTLLRETHDSDLHADERTRIQHNFSYSDGFGREIQQKVQAEPAPFGVRWVGSGWTIFNNKGNPVRKYEPFFTGTHHFEFGVKVGVSPILFYDPLERVVATLYPDHTWGKAVVDPWRHETWDANDTVAVSDPRRDTDVGGFFSRLDETEYLPTWHALRTDPAYGDQALERWPDPETRAAEREAALKASVHAATPLIAHADTLGRTFLTIAHNRFRPADASASDAPSDEFHYTRTDFDIEGNERQITDAMDRVIMRFAYDMLGNRVHQASMEAGARDTLSDVAGKPVHVWDPRNHHLRTSYDALRRVTDVTLESAEGKALLVGRTVYGEDVPDAEVHNLRAKVIQTFDQAGVVTTRAYDFKGNLLRGERQLAKAYNLTLDWASEVPLDNATYISRTRYDALNRPTAFTDPDNSVLRPGYNEANLVDRIDVNLRGVKKNGERVWTPFVTNIDYDAKGQRQRIDYANGVRTVYRRDPLNWRLVHLLTRRNGAAFASDCPDPPPEGWPGCGVQNLHYTYDAVGNTTAIRDRAQQTIYFRNVRVDPRADFTYDALYRLIEATGREHLGQTGNPPVPYSYDDVPRVGLEWSANDGHAMGRYVERYVYDAVGNFLQLQHRGSDGARPGWTRHYEYREPSLLENGANGTALKVSNRLTGTTVGATSETYSVNGDGYDPHGNMLRMPHLHVIQWDFQSRLQLTQRQVVNDSEDDGDRASGQRTWYVYDINGRRIRKVTELASGDIQEEHVYLGGFEIHRRHGPEPLVYESLHVMDDQQRVAIVETRLDGKKDDTPDQVIRYQLANHQGSAVLELDDRARVISYEEYSPYGSTTYQTVRAHTFSTKRYRFTGMERDTETGLQYHTARYYMPWLGRWCSADPQGLDDSVNLYAYVSGNPVKLVDTDGLSGWDRALGGLKAVGGAFEVYAGVSLVAAGVATSEIGIGVVIAAAGVLVTAHGADTVASGVATMVSGEEVDTFTSQGLQAAGMTRTQANLADAGIGIVGTLGASAIVKAPSIAGTAARTLPAAAEATPTAARVLPAAAEAAPQAARALPAAAEAAPTAARALPAAAEAAPSAARALPAAAEAAPQAARALPAAAAAVPKVAAAAPRARAVASGASASRAGAVGRAASATKSAAPQAFGTGARLVRAKAIVAEAAKASGIQISKYVDEVRYAANSSSFFEVTTAGRRILTIGSQAFGRTRAGQILEGAHELVHAQQYALALQRAGGNVAAAIKAFNSAKFGSAAYAADEVMAETLALRRVAAYLKLSPQQVAAASKYIKGWQAPPLPLP